MKKILTQWFCAMSVFAAIVAFNGSAFGDDSSESHGSSAVESDSKTSHNPLTNTTTKVDTRKSKYRRKNKDGTSTNVEDRVEMKRKDADDGSKSSIKTEKTHTEEHNQ